MIHCTFEDGGKASLRHVTVGVIAVNTENQVLLIKRAPNTWNGNKYSIPGGILDRDEDSKAGALRELFEETGLRAKDLKLFRVNDNPNRPKEDRQNVDVIYVTERANGEIKTDKEVSTAEWIDENNLPTDDEFAFDHRDSIVRYFEFRKNPFTLPIVG